MQHLLRHSLLALALIAFVTIPAAAQTTAKPAPKPAPKAAPKAAPATALPPAIDAAFKKAYPAAVIKHVSKEKEGGKDVYEIESVDNGMRRDLIYKPDGTVVSYEEEIAESSLPAAVGDAIKKRYPKATKTRIEKVFEGGKVEYEIALKGGPASVTLTAEGQWVSPKGVK